MGGGHAKKKRLEKSMREKRVKTGEKKGGKEKTIFTKGDNRVPGKRGVGCPRGRKRKDISLQGSK